MSLTFGSLFSGIGGFDLGFERAGMTCKWQVEDNTHCNKVLNRHWPHVERHEDVRDFQTTNSVPDVICGGFPCQDLSVAGRRAGLAGKRSGLWDEFRRVIAGMRPGWVVIENVPGLLSSNGGRDMGTILRALGKLGYRWAYRVLDAQYDGVAQRRRRVFIVGSLGGRTHPAKVFFDSESLPGNSPPSRSEKSDVAGTIDAGTGERRGAGQIPSVMTSLCLNGKNGNRFDGESETFVVNCLDSHMGGGGPDDNAAQANHLVAFDCQQDPVIGAIARGLSGNGMNQAVSRGTQVRRLTPTECERLQGFPDDWTRFADDGSELSDSARYRMLGNAVCVPVAEWVGRKIVT